MPYDFGQQILGAISQTLDRNEQQRQYNINDQWRKYALSQDLTDREKQRVFLHDERLGGEEHEDVMQGAGFKHAKGMQEALFKENRWDKTHGQTFDPKTWKIGWGDFTNMGDSMPATEFGLNVAMMGPGFDPGYHENKMRPDLPERAVTGRGLTGGLLDAVLRPFGLSKPLAKALTGYIAGPEGFNMSTSMDENRAESEAYRQAQLNAQQSGLTLKQYIHRLRIADKFGNKTFNRQSMRGLLGASFNNQ